MSGDSKGATPMLRSSVLSIGGAFIAVLSLGAALAVVGPVTSATAASSIGVVCAGDECDDHRWESARSESYWGATSGHNCTNYVAWRLIGDGVATPAISMGAAKDWSTNAVLNGLAIDEVPEIGSIAQWDANAGRGSLGHVAYVEDVYDDGTILVSQDSWRPSGVHGPLRFEVVRIASISHFIHFFATSRTLHEVSASEAGWTSHATDLRILPDSMAGVMAGGTPRVLYTDSGTLHEAARTDAGWTSEDTGLEVDGAELSAVDIGRGSSFLATVNDGMLEILSRGWGSWQRIPTDVGVTGHIAAVAEGGLLPAVLISQDGWLFRAWNDAEGWRVLNTGVALDGPIRAVSPRPGVTDVFFELRGSIHVVASFGSPSGWSIQDTGIAAARLVDVTTSAGRSVLLLEQGGELAEAVSTPAGWITSALGVAAGTRVVGIDTEGRNR